MSKAINATVYKEWLIGRKRRGRMEDLAGDVKRDKSWPQGDTTTESLVSHLRMKNACCDAIDTLRASLRNYFQTLEDPK